MLDVVLGRPQNTRLGVCIEMGLEFCVILKTGICLPEQIADQIHND